MGLFSFLQTKDINSGVRSFLSTEGAVLLDVRTPEEYAEGHIVGSKNIPLQSIEKTESVITDKILRFLFIAEAVQEAHRQQAFSKEWDIQI